jgi:hypothetical protein
MAFGSYLRRRIDWFLEKWGSGQILLADTFPLEMRDELLRDISRVQRGVDGGLQLNTCGPLLRSLARSFYGFDKSQQVEVTSPRVAVSVTPRERVQLQRDYFDIVRAFFLELTGRRASDFRDVGEFGSFIRTEAAEVSKRAESAFPSLSKGMNEFYKAHTADAYEHARSLGGLNLVLGGQRLSTSAVSALRSVMLYSDTVFVADPILPWLEQERSEERFNHVLPLEAAYLLLQLDPLVAADLPVPAVLVFPSWEKTLERDDEHTQDGISSLFLRFVNHHLNTRFEDESEVYEYAVRNESLFLEAVQAGKLFWPPGGDLGESLPEAIESYRAYIRQWWSKPVQDRALSLSGGELVARGIFDRLVPQFHLVENAGALDAHPLLSIDPHWHYFRLCASVNAGDLLAIDRVQRETIATLASLSRTEYRWLGEVPTDALVTLRQDGANQEFRRKLREAVSILHDARLDELDVVSREISRSIVALLAEHDREVEELESRFKKRYGWTAMTSWLSLGAAVAPLLAPYLPLLGAADAALRYAQDKSEEVLERRKTERSLCGVLAAAARAGRRSP